MAGPTDGIFRTSDSCEISYTVHPAPGKPRVALIHSLALDRSVWDGVVKELSSKAEILTYDCRGHGRSGRKAGTYTCELFSRDLAELLDYLKWPAVIVAGCSMGGCIAQAFAASYSKRTLGACFIDTTAWYGTAAPKQWRERAATGRTQGLGALIDFQVTRWFSEGFRASRPDAEAPQQRLADEVRRPTRGFGDADVDVGLAEIDRQQLSVAIGEVQQVHVAEARQVVKLLALRLRQARIERDAARRGGGKEVQEFTPVHRLVPSINARIKSEYRSCRSARRSSGTPSPPSARRSRRRGRSPA